MSKTERSCKNCNKPFLVENKEINRGNGLFCTISCATSYNNSKQSYNISNICKHCGKSFLSIKVSKYCSSSCKQKNYRFKKKSNIGYDKQLTLLLQEYPCEICDWKEAPRDVHHIIPVSNNGKTIFENLISLCPNHHRMVHYNLFSQDYLLKIAKSRTISSSLESLLVKIKSKEQDANLVIKET